MRILVACEFSGIVRDAFARRGHDAWSCDILPGEGRSNHYQCMVESVIENGWDIMNAPIVKIAIDNPVSIISTKIRKPDQIIQPWQFGHPEAKKTCLWLKGLPRLVPTNVLQLPACGHWDNQTPSGQNKLGPGPDRWAT